MQEATNLSLANQNQHLSSVDGDLPHDHLDLEELSCVLIPNGGQLLLLPNVSVAEIVNYRSTKPMPTCPQWVVGLTGWRGQTIPVIDFELLQNPQSEQGTQKRCLVVMNRAKYSGGFPFYGMVASSLPRLVQLTEDDIADSAETLEVSEIMKVTFGTEMATIPDLGYLERQVAELPI